MNTGGEPGRDDYGLPPVNIEIPDDARELDRDVQAYYRELRAGRRRLLTQRLHGPLTRDGMVLPLLAGCLALTLLAATLLTVFTAGQASFVPGSRARSNQAAPAAPGQVGGPLPDATVMVAGQPVPLRDVRISVLALVPSGCGCGGVLAQLAQQASQAGVRMYVVGSEGSQVTTLIRRLGLDATNGVVDTTGSLGIYHHPGQLTAVLVDAGGSVTRIAQYQGQGFQLGDALRALWSAQPQGLPGSLPRSNAGPAAV